MAVGSNTVMVDIRTPCGLMLGTRICKVGRNGKQGIQHDELEDDVVIMTKVRSIIARGNNAEIKGKKDGSLAILEVKKNIV